MADRDRRDVERAHALIRRLQAPIGWISGGLMNRYRPDALATDRRPAKPRRTRRTRRRP